MIHINRFQSLTRIKLGKNAIVSIVRNCVVPLLESRFEVSFVIKLHIESSCTSQLAVGVVTEKRKSAHGI